VAVDAAAGPAARARKRRLWLGGTLAVTALPIGVAVWTAPSASAAPGPALVWLLFVGSSVHVAATAWFYSVAEVRRHMMQHRTRYVWAPVALVLITATIASVVGPSRFGWVLLVFFAWQFHHFQKQNLGLTALAARAHGARGLNPVERRALVAAGIGGILALVGHPRLLQVAGTARADWVFRAGVIIFCSAVLSGLVALTRRAAADRPVAFVGVYVTSLLFFAPALLFSSPYAAVAGLTIGHGLQYLLLVGLVAAVPADGRSGRLSVLVLLNVALLLGLGLNRLSHLHVGGAASRALFGAYLGLVMAHFVIDAGLWRLRDEFPRAFLARRLPFLLVPS
jgi:hypothetical protein